MIIGLILTTFTSFVDFVLLLFPVGTLDTSVNTTVQNFFQYVYQFNDIFPVDTAFRILEWVAIFWVLIFLFDFLKWLIHLVRGN